MSAGVPDLPDTHVGHVPMWEIDANGHWNTQYYLRAFQQAAERVALAAGGANPGAACARVRHLRFFRELRGLEPMRVGSARAGDGIVHLMRHGTTGALCATALDTGGAAPPGLPLLEDAAAWGPRSIAPGLRPPADTDALLAEGRAALTHVGILRPQEFDHTGAYILNTVLTRVSDGGGNLWQHIGVSPADFYANGLGRAIVELKVGLHGTAEPGAPVRLVSWFEAIAGRTFRLHHQLDDLRTGAAIADAAAVTLVLSLETRRSVDLPAPLREAFARLS